MKKRGFSLLLCCVLLCCLLPGSAQEDGGEWPMILAALGSDEADPVPLAWRRHVQEGQLNPDKALPSHVMNILLLGTDAPDMSENRGRTEVMLLCSVDLSKGDIRLAALPETARVLADGLPGPVRLKYVNCFGGPLYALRTVNQVFSLNAERYCAVNFDTFIRTIDRLGGAELKLTPRECAAVGVPEGTETLTGEQALRYVKLRWGEAVTDRPRKLLEAVLNKALTGGLDKTFALASTLLPALDSNLTTGDIMELLFGVLVTGQGSFEAFALPDPPGGEREEITPEDVRWLRQKLYGTDPA